jgi:hypothetical protein
MKNFIFGLSTGIVAGVGASFVGTILLMVVIEDSPEILKTLSENYQKSI